MKKEMTKEEFIEKSIYEWTNMGMSFGVAVLTAREEYDEYIKKRQKNE